MQIPSTTGIRMFIPVWAPLGTDPALFPCQVALVPDEDGREPGPAEYHPGDWADGEASLKPPAGQTWGDLYDDGEFMAWVRVDATASADPQIVVLKAGRVRIGELGDQD